MTLRLIDGPAVYPVTLDEAKTHLRVTTAGDDTYISALIAAASQLIDGKDGLLQRAVVMQTWELVLDEFPDAIRVPLPPLQSVTYIRYVDDDGIEQTLATDQYDVDAVSEPGWIVPGLDGWPDVGQYINAVTVRFVAGYLVVPAPIKAALLLMIGHLYENREDVVTGSAQQPFKMPNASEWLLAPYKVYLL